jgi:hypothetical protein
MIDSRLYKRHAEDQPGMDRWLKANAAFGAIVAVGLVVMALIGSTGSEIARRPGTTFSAADVGRAAVGVQASAASPLGAQDR